MLYQVKVTAFANEIGRQLSPEIRKAAKAALRELAENPDLGKELQAELSGFRFYRFMRYRLVYKIDSERKHVIAWAIGHRRDIYENLGDNILKFSPETK